MRAGLGRDLGQLGDDMWWRRAVRIAHAKVDNILTAGTGSGLHRIHFGEDIGRQALDTVEVVGHAPF